MIFSNVHEVLNQMKEQKGESLNGLSMRAGIAYSTVHAWYTGKSSPNVEKFRKFLIANDFLIRIVRKV